MKTASDPKDILEFQFKQLSKLKISEGFQSVPPACNLIAVDGKRGLIYTACDNKIIVLRSGGNPDIDWKREYVLSSNVSRLALNCDCSFLAVTLSHPTAYIYSAASFTQQNLELLREIKLSSTENVHVLDLRWNPCIPGALCTITSDYTVGSFNITADKTSAILTILEKLEKLEVLCVAWSPKGKQLVVGCKNGNLLQLKPDLKVARSIVGPNPSIGSIIALLWISNYQFCAAYLDPQDSRINVLIIDAPKGEAIASFTSYEDITYGSPGVEGEEGGPRYYFEHVPEWGLIVAASSGSSEVAVLGSRDNGISWEQWQLVDSGRAQLPFIRRSESYPVGLAVDRTSIDKLPWGGEGSTLPHPVPILHILGTSGQLCSFHMVNLFSGIPGICSPPTVVVQSSQQPRISLAPTEISFNLVGGVTSTPRPKQTEAISQDKQKTTVTTNLFAETSRVPIPQPQVEVNVTKPPIENVETLSKQEVPIIATKEVHQVQQEKVGIDSNICIHTYQEECSLFETELKSRKEVQTVDIGSVTERNKLIEKSEEMERFLNELQETTASHTSDISCLKNLLLQTFAWLEETKSRHSSDTLKNPQTHGNNTELKELQNQMYYVQSQLEQAMQALDHEWLEHMNREKSKMKVPKLEFVYQNMLRHSQIIAKEKSSIQALVKKWKSLTRGDISMSLNKSMAHMSLFSLDNTNAAIEQRCKTIASRNCSFSREKQSKLRNLLSRSVPKIIKTATPSEIHDRLKETLSSLATLSPPKQVKEEKPKSMSGPKQEQTIIATTPSTQIAKSPLASLDRIVANIGSISTQPNTDIQNRMPGLIPASVSPQILKISQVSTKARAATPSTTPQTPTAIAQPRQNKPPMTVSLFGTPQTPKTVSAISSGLKSATILEISPFISNAPNRTSVPSSLPAPLTPATVTAVPASKPFSKGDIRLFNSGNVKTDTSPMPTISVCMAPASISTAAITPAPMSTAVITPAPTSTAVITPAPPQHTNAQTTFSFSTPTQPPTSQLPSYPTTLKTSPAAITTSIGAKSSPMQSFSFASKPSSTTFSFASKPATSPPTSAGQSLDLTAIGLDLQAPANTPVENLTPATTVANNSFFGSAASPSSGSLFGGASVTTKDEAPGTIFGGSSFSSIFSGSNVTNNATSAYGGNTLSSGVKSPIFGGGTTSPPTSIFGGTAAGSPKSSGSEIPAASLPSSKFESPTNSSSTSIFGNISSTANTASIFGGNSSSQIINTSPLGGATDLPSQSFGETSTSLIKPPIFSSDSVGSPTATVFSSPPDAKASMFGGVPTPLFGNNATGSPGASIFGGNISSSTPASSGGSVFGTVPPMASNQSIFGGAASNPNAATNIGAVAPTPVASMSAFGQAATFGAKPEFGSIFGASKPVFGGSGFASSTFPVASQPTGGFGGFNTSMGGNDSAMGAGASMQKVFGETSGSSTFENLAAQEGGLTFGNLAQNQSEPAPPPPAFSGGSSFQSWR